MTEKMEFVYLVKIYDSTGRLLPIVTAFATRQGAETYVHDFLPTGKYQQGAAACKAEIVKTEVRDQIDLQKCNEAIIIEGFQHFGEQITLIDTEYEQKIKVLLG